MISTLPSGGTDVSVANSWMNDCVGAVSGTLSQARRPAAAASAIASRTCAFGTRSRRACIAKKNSEAMQLAQGIRSGERGYAMAGLLVAIAVMSLMLSVAMPAYRTMVQREKEEELIWRGQQYDRAIQLDRPKTGAPGPPSPAVLREGEDPRHAYRGPLMNA